MEPKQAWSATGEGFAASAASASVRASMVFLQFLHLIGFAVFCRELGWIYFPTDIDDLLT